MTKVTKMKTACIDLGTSVLVVVASAVTRGPASAIAVEQCIGFALFNHKLRWNSFVCQCFKNVFTTGLTLFMGDG